MAEYQIVELKLCENCARQFVRHDTSLLCDACQSMSSEELQQAAVAAGHGVRAAVRGVPRLPLATATLLSSLFKRQQSDAATPAA